MGILDRNKSPAVLSKSSMQSVSIPNGTKQQFASSAHSKAIGSKKASYSFLTNNNVENLDLHQPAEFCHDNPVFESELVDKADRVFDSETKIVITSINKNPDNIQHNSDKKLEKQAFAAQIPNSTNLPQQINSDTSDLEPNESNLNTSEALSLTNEATLVLQKSKKKGQYAVSTSNTTLVYAGSAQSQQSSSRLQDNTELLERSPSSYNTAEKLAAAAAVVSSSSNSIVEIPNFGEGLTSMMEQSRMDEVENGTSFETKINKSHGFIYGEGNSLSKKQLTKSENVSQDDDCGMKSTKFSAYDIKLRRKKSCQLKALVVFLAMLAAACIGVMIAYFFVKYSNEHEKYLRYTQNMVAERESLPGSNKLEVIVPFEANLKNMIYEDKVALTKKIQEIVLKSFRNMNKTVEHIDVYKLVEGSNGFHEAYIDVVLKNALDFSYAPLTVGKKTGRISLARSSKLLSNYQNILRNTTKSAFRHIKRDFLNLDFDKISITFDNKKPNETLLASNGTDTDQDRRLLIEKKAVDDLFLSENKEVSSLLKNKIIGLKKSLSKSSNKSTNKQSQTDDVFVQEYVVVEKKPLDETIKPGKNLIFKAKDSVNGVNTKNSLDITTESTKISETKSLEKTTTVKSTTSKIYSITTTEPSTTTTTKPTTTTTIKPSTTTSTMPTTSTSTQPTTITTKSTSTTTIEPSTSTTTEPSTSTTTEPSTSTTTELSTSTTTEPSTSTTTEPLTSTTTEPLTSTTTEPSTSTTTEPSTSTTTETSTSTTTETSTSTTTETSTSTTTEPSTSTTTEPSTSTTTELSTSTTTEPSTSTTTEPSTSTTTEPSTSTTTEPSTSTTTEPSTTTTTTSKPTTTTTTESSTITETEPSTTTKTGPSITTTTKSTTVSVKTKEIKPETTSSIKSTSTATSAIPTTTTTTIKPTTTTESTTTTPKATEPSTTTSTESATIPVKTRVIKPETTLSIKTAFIATSEIPNPSKTTHEIVTESTTKKLSDTTRIRTPSTTTVNKLFRQALINQKLLFQESKKLKPISTATIKTTVQSISQSTPEIKSLNEKRLMATEQMPVETLEPKSTTRNNIFHQALLKQKKFFENSKKSSETNLSTKKQEPSRTEDLFTKENLILVKDKRTEKTTRSLIQSVENEKVENRIIKKLRQLMIEPSNKLIHDDSLDTVEFDIGFKAL